MIDHGPPLPELQYLIHGHGGEMWRSILAWPDMRLAGRIRKHRVARGTGEMLRDKTRWAKLQEPADDCPD